MWQHDLKAVRQRWNSHFCGEDGYIQAWTFVPNSILDGILSGEIQECPLEKADDEFTFQLAYEWMKDCMDHAGLVGRKSSITPWWCWIRAGDGHVKPTKANSGPGFSLVELRLHPDQVLLSDFDFWHVVLNYWLNAEEKDSEAFDAELATHGLDIYRDKPLPEPFHSVVQESWKDTFHLDSVNGFTGDFENKSIQGVFWKLSPEMIIGVVEPDDCVEEDEDETEEKSPA